jgi:hypothetical protein
MLQLSRGYYGYKDLGPHKLAHQNHPPSRRLEKATTNISRDVDVSILGCCDGRRRMRYKSGFWGSVVGAPSLRRCFETPPCTRSRRQKYYRSPSKMLEKRLNRNHTERADARIYYARDS